MRLDLSTIRCSYNERKLREVRDFGGGGKRSYDSGLVVGRLCVEGKNKG